MLLMMQLVITSCALILMRSAAPAFASPQVLLWLPGQTS
jgi:hypothetical protein